MDDHSFLIKNACWEFKSTIFRHAQHPLLNYPLLLVICPIRFQYLPTKYFQKRSNDRLNPIVTQLLVIFPLSHYLTIHPLHPHMFGEI